MLLNHDVADDTLESLGQQGVNPKGNQFWIFIGRTDAEVETSVFGQRMWRTDSLEKTLMLEKTEGWKRRGNRGWDDWMASPTQWTWVWAISRSWWWTGKPGVLQSMGSQKVGHNWASELNWTDTHRKGNKVKCLQLDNLGKKILYTIFTTFCRPEITNNKNYHDKNFKDVGCCTELGTQMFNKLYFSDVLYILSDAETSWEAI